MSFFFSVLYSSGKKLLKCQKVSTYKTESNHASSLLDKTCVLCVPSGVAALKKFPALHTHTHSIYCA